MSEVAVKRTVISAGDEIILVRPYTHTVAKAIFLGKTKHKFRVRDGGGITQISRTEAKIIQWDPDYFKILQEAADLVHKATNSFHLKAKI